MDTTSEVCVRWDANAYLAYCPSRTVLSAIADKWTCLLVSALSGGPLRFGELRRRLDGITQKSLTQTLRDMERDGMLTRTVYPTIPPKVSYELTDLGRSVIELMAGIKTWSERHADEIVAARARYDDLSRQELPPVTTTPAAPSR